MNQDLLPHLFRTEYRKIISVLSKLFGFEHIEIVEDIVSDTFFTAAELWGLKGNPENPTAWLYTVAKNKARNHLRRNQVFAQKVSQQLKYTSIQTEEIEIDMSVKNINDSQLAMIFAICTPCISTESQIGLALSLLCGFGTDEIASAFLTSKDGIYKRLQRAKEKVKSEKVKIEDPSIAQINERLPNVLTTLYLLFNEGYYSATQDNVIRKDLCLEAMRLCYLLVENKNTNVPQVKALLSLMCFHASRFGARTNENGEMILYEDQDESLWDEELIKKGAYYLKEAFENGNLTKYHLEAGIAYCHTQKEDRPEKWEAILQLYNQLLQLEYSPVIALNRTYALSKAYGKTMAIAEAKKLNLKANHFYFSLLGNLYTGIDNKKALECYSEALSIAVLNSHKISIQNNIDRMKRE